MSFFTEHRVQAFCVRLIDSPGEKGELFDSRHGRQLLGLLQAVDGVKPVRRSARYQLTDTGRMYIRNQLAQVQPAKPTKSHFWQELGLTLPSLLNQASFSALHYGDSKHPYSENTVYPPNPDITLTQDEVIRLRTLDPLLLIDQHGQSQDMTALMGLLGELVLPERALAALKAVDWQGQQVITVENKGAFVDYPLQHGQLVLFVPGRNTTLAKRLIPLLPHSVEWAHFGDLDQRGVDIAVELANALGRVTMLWLPADLQPFLHHYAKSLPRFIVGKIPWRPSLLACADDAKQQGVPPWLDTLVKQGCWLEQEVLIIASRWQAWPLGVASIP